MVNVNPNRESCMEYMKELIRQKLPRNEVVEECKLALMVFMEVPFMIGMT